MGLTRTWGARGSPCCLAEPGFPPLWGAVLGPPEWSPLCLLPLSLPALLLLLPAGSLVSTNGSLPVLWPCFCSVPFSAPYLYSPRKDLSGGSLDLLAPGPWLEACLGFRHQCAELRQEDGLHDMKHGLANNFQVF